ncbi:MAG: hypothetical protein V1739_02235 [Candidatus Omnitrophota bacterium]
MKKIYILMFIITLLSCNAYVQAAQVGSMISVPLDIVEADRLSINAEGSIVSEINLDTKNGISNSVDESTQIGLKISYGITEGVSFYAKLGMADWSITNSTPMTTEYENAPYYGGGISYVYRSESNILVGGDIQYIMQSGVDVDSITYSNTAAANITGLEGDFNTMQISVLLGYDLELSEDMRIVPYGGLTYSKFEYESAAGSFTAGSTINQAAQSLDSDDVLGFIAGLSLKMGSNLDITLEERFVAESAFSIGFNYRF